MTALLVGIVAITANADNIATIEGKPIGTLVTLDSEAVVTAIISQPGTVNGVAYTTWAFTVDDGTGSMWVYGNLPTGSVYTPMVGDAINAVGTYRPYHQIPEIQSLREISRISSGNPISAPLVKTIPDVNLTTLPLDIAGYLITIEGVTISGATGKFGPANQLLTMTDNASNSMALYYWPGNYSACNANLADMDIPTGKVDVTGFVSVYSSLGTETPEFTPISIKAVPEPSAFITLLGLGLVGSVSVWRCRRGR